MDAMEAAFAELDLMEKKMYTEVAKKHGIDRTTLSRRYRGITKSKAEAYNSQKLLSPGKTKALIKYINNLSERGLPPTHQMIRNLAQDLAGRMPGIHWVSRWVHSNSKHLKSAYLLPIDKERKRADSALYYSLYFKLLDEKGFLIGKLVKKKRIFSKLAYKLGRMRHVIQDGNREWITVVAAICADNTALPPTLIYQAGTNNRKTGIHPWNPEVILDQFNAKKEKEEDKDEERPLLSNSTGSALTAGDWKRIETRLKQVVEVAIQSSLQKEILAEDNNRKAAVYSPNKVRQARELYQEKEDAKARDTALKAEEKVQKQLAKEEKERIAEFNRSAKAAKQREQKDAEDLKKRKAQEAREARDAEKQLKDERKVIQQRQKARQVVFTIPEEPTGQQNHEVEEGVVKSTSGRPQRIRNTPKRYDDSVIMIE
ncbi:uncharacterized protein BDZ99DRAFT_503812 [Mytilinidion resinicola]|uniref:HTH CENPB-type domain-containing protein n=3 Tax=Mytilinidion resinicola TaxID=574789 RepID=A0A6A6Y1W1_9PEZI|nr:uncharacterized protein BDZ99DRAFT_503812 [Mytilinidion resinicola]KAF2802629.1 hypothetical protein BDZ99DRAFT_503812 [Mytilinidion resinicola]